MATIYNERKGKVDLQISDEKSSETRTNGVNITNKEIKKKGLKWYIWLIIGISALLIIGVIIYIAIPKCKKGEKCSCKDGKTCLEGNTDDTVGNIDESGGNTGTGSNTDTGGNTDIGGNTGSGGNEAHGDNEDNDIIDMEEIKKGFEQNFKINSNINTLSQIEMKLKQNYVSKSDNLSELSFVKAKLDIYIINETIPENTDYFSKKYYSSITINSFCTEISQNDCELIQYLDLNYKSSNNLRTNTEDSEIEEVILPICIMEHTDTNIILSITCPKTLENNLRNIIKNAFECIKPMSIKGFSEDKNLSDTVIETKDDKTYINSFTKFCDDEDYEIGKECESNLNTIIDKDGNFISSKKVYKYETDAILNNYEYNFEDISKNNAELDPNNYKINLDKILELIKNIMENNEIAETKIRNLPDIEVIQDKGSQVISPLNVTYFGINVSYSYMIDSGYQSDNAKLYSTFSSGNKSKEMYHNEIESTFNKIIDEFVALSKAGNSLGTDLYDQLNGLLNEIKNKINEGFNNLDIILIFKDLSAIFDSTFAISGLSEFPYTLVSSAKNLYLKIKELNDDLLYLVDDYKKQLNSDISTFITNSHSLLYNIFTNLKELSTALSSQKSIIASIASYYGLNNTNNSYVNVIEDSKDILYKYYIKEKELIEPIINSMINNFTLKSNKLILNGQYILDNITNRLENNSVVINRGNDDDIRNVIDNLYNSKIIENQIIPNIAQIMKNKLFKDNGYLETQENLEQTNISYSQISEDALKSAQKLVNNEYVEAHLMIS